jgi:hypothetical protein
MFSYFIVSSEIKFSCALESSITRIFFFSTSIQDYIPVVSYNYYLFLEQSKFYDFLPRDLFFL